MAHSVSCSAPCLGMQFLNPNSSTFSRFCPRFQLYGGGILKIDDSFSVTNLHLRTTGKRVSILQAASTDDGQAALFYVTDEWTELDADSKSEISSAIGGSAADLLPQSSSELDFIQVGSEPVPPPPTELQESQSFSARGFSESLSPDLVKPPIDPSALPPPPTELQESQSFSDGGFSDSLSPDLVKPPIDPSAVFSSPSTDKVLEEAAKSLKAEPLESREIGDPSETISQSLKVVSDAIKKAISQVGDVVNTSQERISNSLHDLQDSSQSTIIGTENSIKGAYDGLNKSISDYVRDVTGSFEVSLKETLYSLPSVFSRGTPANDALKKLVSMVEQVTSATLSGFGKLTVEVYTTSKAALPSDVQASLDVAEKKLAEFTEPVGSVAQQAYLIITDVERSIGLDPENPVIPVFLFLGGSIFFGTSIWLSKYGGYSGDLSPKATLDLLMKEGNAVLVDIRTEELRESEGIPDLRRQARFKYATIEISKVNDDVRRLLRNASEIDDLITATIICNLKNVERNTKVLILDTDGSLSKRIARALRKSGIQRPYCVHGGFRAWAAEGLTVKEVGVDTPLRIIKEETEAILEEFKPSAGEILLVGVGVVAGIYAIVEWEKALQLVGVIGIGQALYTRFTSYESVDDIKSDLRVILRPFDSATQGVIWMAGRLEPRKLQLATTPSTPAVQDRVLKAAAKHGPTPSELEQQQQSTEESSAEPGNLVSTVDSSPNTD